MPTIVASIFSGLVVAGLVAYTVKYKALTDHALQRNRNGNYVMGLFTRNRILVYLSFSFSIVVFLYATFDSSLSVNDKIAVYLLGLFLIIFGVFMISFSVYDRIEYNEVEIKQYRMFRKHPQVIRWDELNHIKIQRIGPLVELYGSKDKVYIDFNNNGFIHLLYFMTDECYLSRDKSAMINEILKTLQKTD